MPRELIISRVGGGEVTAKGSQRIGALQFCCDLQLAIGGIQLASLDSYGREMWGRLLDGRNLRAATQDEDRGNWPGHADQLSPNECFRVAVGCHVSHVGG